MMEIRDVVSAAEARVELTHLKYFKCSLEVEEEVWVVWVEWEVWEEWEEAWEDDQDVEGKNFNSDLADNICNYLFINN
jgi:hypothetical protein